MVFMTKMIFSIKREIGIPLSLGDYTKNKNKSWGFFACILVDVDLLSNLPNQILVKILGFAFIVYVKYKNLLYFVQIVKWLVMITNFK